MKIIGLTFILISLIHFNIYSQNESALIIIQKVINKIDSIETIYYKQDMHRTNPNDLSDTIFRYREMYFKRLITDSIVGVKGHWYMYTKNNIEVTYEDIYDGNILARKNNNDSVARIYDLNKYPDFRNKHFWSHNTLYGIQYELKNILSNPDYYLINRLNDTIIDNKKCYQVVIVLENMVSMPGFALKLEKNVGAISEAIYIIEKQTCYPIKIKAENYSIDNPEEKYFMDQIYYDIKFNLKIDEVQFSTAVEMMNGYELIEMKPE
jgi:hypothetical protein